MEPAMRRKEGDKHTDLLNAATRVFRRDGFDKAKVAHVAAEANVGTGTVYLYFPSKDDLLAGIFERFWDSIATEFETLAQETNDPVARISQQLRIFFHGLLFGNEGHHPTQHDLAALYLEEHPKWLRRRGRYPEGMERCVSSGQKLFEAGRKQGEFPDTLDLELTRQLLFGSVRAAAEICVWDRDRKPEVVIETAIAWVLRGLGHQI
jgi:AcrR family transcriptional regulator